MNTRLMLAPFVTAVLLSTNCVGYGPSLSEVPSQMRLADPGAAKVESDRILALAKKEKDPAVAGFLKDCASLARLGIPTLRGATYQTAHFRAPNVVGATPIPDRPVWVYPDGHASLDGASAVSPARLDAKLALSDPLVKPDDAVFPGGAPVGRPGSMRPTYDMHPRETRDWMIGQFALVLSGREQLLDKAGLASTTQRLVPEVESLLWEQVLLRREDGDDRSAVADGELYTKIRNELHEDPAWGVSNGRNADQPNIDELIADSNRRLQHPRTAPIDPDAWVNLPKEERIKKLIDGMDELNSFGVSNPGGIMAQVSPYFQKLEDVGDDIVDPLLECAKNDKRLTRFCWETHHAMEEPFLDYPVAHLALAAAADIAGIQNYRSIDDVSAYWAKVRKNTGLNRIVAVLEDPSDKPENWVNAMNRLVSPHFGVVNPGPMRGEPLRTMTNPSLTEVVTARIHELASGGPGSDFAAAELAKDLARWDPSAALPALRMACAQSSAMRLGAVYAWRIRLGDKDAATEYLRWLGTDDRNTFFRSSELEPFRAFPNDPVLSKAAPELFQKLSANTTPDRLPGPWSLLVPCVYDKMRQCLKDRSVIGNVKRDGALCTGAVSYHIEEFVPDVKPTLRNLRELPRYVPYVGQKQDLKASDFIADGASSEILTCDAVARTLAQMHGRPFCYGWTRARRDEAVAEELRWMEANKGKFDKALRFLDTNFM